MAKLLGALKIGITVSLRQRKDGDLLMNVFVKEIPFRCTKKQASVRHRFASASPGDVVDYISTVALEYIIKFISEA